MLHQLRCGGVLEAVRISCAGFPTKTLYEDFVDHFWNLVPELLTADHDLDDKALSKAVLKKANLQGYQCGETKVPFPCLSCAAVTQRQPKYSSRTVLCHDEHEHISCNTDDALLGFLA